MIQRRDQTIKRALEVAREQCQGDADAYLSRLLRTLDGTLGDALAFCWGTIRQVERCANVPTLSTPRDFGLHHVEEHLLFTAANDALSHLDLVERLLEEVKSFCQQDVTPHLDALSNACPTSFRDRLRETRNLLAAHRDERVLYRRLTGEHTARAINAYLRLGIEVPEGSMDSDQIIEEAAVPRRPHHLGEITSWGNWTKPSVHCARTSPSPSSPNRTDGIAQPDVSTSPVEPTHCECRNRCATRK